MAAGEEIDLTGLGSQIEKVNKEILELSKNMSTAENIAKQINNVDMISKLKEAQSGLDKMGFSVKEMVGSLKLGETGIIDFSAYLNKLKDDFSSIKELGVMPVTGLLESLNKIQGGLSAVKNMYDSIAYDKNRLSKLAESSKKIADERRRQAIMEENAAQRERENADYIRKHTSAYKERLKLIQQSSEAQEKLRKKLQEIQEGVDRGDVSAIQKYLKMHTSISRMNNAIAIMRDKQENLNLATRKGAEEYLRYEAHIKKIQATLNRLNGEQSAFIKTFSSLKNTASQIAMSFGIMAGVFGATNFIRNLYRITSEFQLQQRALTAIIQNAREANVLFKQMQNLAVTSPMKFMDLNRYAKQLAAFRIETTNLYDSLKMLGDISVGVGVDMDRLILAYGQVKAANYLRGQELRQFSEAGVNILGGLQQYYQEVKGISMTINEIFDSVSKRKVLFEDVDAVLKRMTQSGGAFYNMQLIQSQTLYGQMQKVGDLFQIQMNEIGSSYSGVLVGMVKFVQVIIKNLRLVVSIVASIASGKGISTLFRRLQEGTLVSKEFAAALALCRTQASLLSKAGWKELITNIRTVSSLSAGLKAGLVGVGVGLAVFASTAIISAIQKHRQRMKELSDEIIEMNNRISSLRDIEFDFNTAANFKSQLVALQRLVDKAREYNYQLTLPANINSKNITKAFAEANKQLEEYIKKEEYYKTTFTDKKLDRKLERLNNLSSDYVQAYEAALNLYRHYNNELKSLSKEEQDIILELNEKFDEYSNDAAKAALKYGESKEDFERSFISQIAEIRKYARGERRATTGTSRDYEGEYGDLLKSIDEFEYNYRKKILDVTNRLGKLISKTTLKLKFKGKQGDELEKAIIDEFPAIKNVFGSVGDFAKEEIIKSIADALDVDYQTLVRARIKYENGDSDVSDSEFKKLMKDFMANDKVIEKQMMVKVTFDLPEGVSLSEGVENAIKDAYGIDFKKEVDKDFMQDVREEIAKALVVNSADEAKKNLDALKEVYKDGLEQYKKAVEAGEKINLQSANIQSKQDIKYFKDAAQGVEYYTLALEKLGRAYKVNNWDMDKSNRSRTESRKQEYQAMIDIIAKLNSTFEDLRNNFDETDGMFAGARTKTIKASKAAFKDMIESFKVEFGSLDKIAFTTGENTIKELERVRKIITEAGPKEVGGFGILSQKEVDDLIRNLDNKIWDIQKKIDDELKKLFDEKLKADVQKFFDDYNLTIELDKLGVDADEVGKLFNIDTKDLLTLENKLESMKEKFVGRNMEKEYRQFMRKIVEINDKANLEMAKKYVKYLREEYGERAKVELEYMRQRAEVYALPFDENETMRILDNLQKETKKKLDEIDWKTFTGSDTYIELFEDLSKASVRSMDYMIDQLKVLKSSLSSLDPSNLKTIVDQIEKLEDELVKRDPFKVLSDSMKSWRDFRKDEKMTSLINEILGNDSDAKIKDFRNTLNKAIDEAKKKVDEARNKVNLQNALFGAAKQRDEAANWAVENIEGINWDNVYNLGGMQRALKEIEEERDKLSKRINAQKLIGVTSEEGLSGDEKLYLKYSKYAEYISKVVSALEALQKTGDKYTSASDLEKAWKDANGDLEKFLKNLKELESGKRSFDKIGEAAIEAGKQLADMATNMKNAYTSINEYLDSIGVATSAVGEAWKEFGSTMFDTVIQALQMIPQMVASIVSAETAINAAAGWIGLIAEAITLVMGLAKSLAGLYDAYKQDEIDKLQKSLDRLEKTANDLDEAFDSVFDEDRLRAFDAALIKTRELEIATLEAMMAAEKAKKKSDQSVIDGYQDQIDSLNDELQDGIDKFYESLGGFGSEANMKSMAESWTDAWYDAFKETGDGLSGLEDSFDEFIDNLYKKTILNKLADKYFKDLYTQLDSILATEGGLTNNLDAFNDWIGLVQNAFDGFNEDATAAMNALSNVYGAGGGLEGLQASLQGMTEETADILAAYLNTVRLYVADNNQLLQNLYNVMAIDNDANPMLQQLKIIAAQTTAIHNVFDSVVSFGGDVSGNFVKVKISQ